MPKRWRPHFVLFSVSKLCIPGNACPMRVRLYYPNQLQLGYVYFSTSFQSRISIKARRCPMRPVRAHIYIRAHVRITFHSNTTWRGAWSVQVARAPNTRTPSTLEHTQTHTHTRQRIHSRAHTRVSPRPAATNKNPTQKSTQSPATNANTQGDLNTCTHFVNFHRIRMLSPAAAAGTYIDHTCKFY